MSLKSIREYFEPITPAGWIVIVLYCVGAALFAIFAAPYIVGF